MASTTMTLTVDDEDGGRRLADRTRTVAILNDGDHVGCHCLATPPRAA